MHFKKILPLLIAILALPFAMKAQVTTSSISGTVKSKTNESLAGATVTAVHLPTGTVYTSSSRSGGRFEINNMNPGGPYRITTSYVGYDNDVKEDINLSLGEVYGINIQMGQKATDLATVVVTGTGRGAVKTGAESSFGRNRIENQPTVGRNLSDYLRGVPQMKLSSGGNASSENAMSFAGQNVRYNSFYIDGAVNNDVFGLAYSGTNGGQSSVSPISIDAIDQLQVQISPYNTSVGNFTGGAINAITKSGTNELHGSAYYIFRNQNLSGKTPTGPKANATKLSNYDNKTFGATLGGAIIKNKLFYFVSAEMQRDQTVDPFILANYTGNTKDPAALQTLIAAIKSKGGGYDPGTYENNVGEVKADRITAKVDWNINPKNKLTMSYRYNKGNKISVFSGSPTTINFYKSGYVFPSSTNSASAELKSNVGKSSSNRLLLTFTNVEDDRGPIGGQAFPSVQIFDGTTQSIYFGTDASSVFNYLKQSTYNAVEQFKFNLGKNTITVGAEAEYYKAYNTFIQNTLGSYRYSSVADFLADAKPNQYIAGFPNIGGTDEKNTDAAAKFDIFKGAAYINDEIRISQNFTVTAGVRIDKYSFLTDPRYDQFAIDSALPKFAQYYDLRGANPSQKAKVPVAFSPRAGFTYNIPEENITIRGGAGLFAGRIPMVWPGGLYNNNGLSVGGYTLNSSTNTAIWNANLVRFRTNVYMPQEVGISLANAKGQLNLISKEFKMPKVFRTSIAFDKRFGKGWSSTFEALVTKNINDIYYQNVNLLPPSLTMATGPDTRLIYPSANTIPIRSTGANPYNGVYLIENATGKKPFSYNLTLSVSKTTRNGFTMFTSYNYGQSQVLNEAQSSTNSSQWSSQETVAGRNFVGLSQSDNSAGSRIQSYVSKKFTYGNRKFSTTVSLSYTGQSGQPFSYVYNGQVVRDGISGNDLLFIPTATQLQAMTFTTSTFNGVSYTDVQQKAAFETYIQNDKYLNKHRGEYAERNGSRVPFSHDIDLKIAQNFNVKVANKTYTFEVAYSMFNFTNFLNRKWGKQYYQASDAYSIVGFSYASATNLTPRYTFNPNTATPGAVSTTVTPSYSSRWLSQLEFRIKF